MPPKRYNAPSKDKGKAQKQTSRPTQSEEGPSTHRFCPPSGSHVMTTAAALMTLQENVIVDAAPAEADEVESRYANAEQNVKTVGDMEQVDEDSGKGKDKVDEQATQTDSVAPGNPATGTICLHPPTHRSVVYPCKHYYCFNCIKEWLKNDDKLSCPVCRSRLVTIHTYSSLGRLQILNVSAHYNFTGAFYTERNDSNVGLRGPITVIDDAGRSSSIWIRDDSGPLPWETQDIESTGGPGIRRGIDSQPYLPQPTLSRSRQTPAAAGFNAFLSALGVLYPGATASVLSSRPNRPVQALSQINEREEGHQFELPNRSRPLEIPETPEATNVTPAGMSERLPAAPRRSSLPVSLTNGPLRVSNSRVHLQHMMYSNSVGNLRLEAKSCTCLVSSDQ